MMADLSQTAANVVWLSGPKGRGKAGGTITQGMPVYIDTSDDNKLKPADADAEASAAACGVALQSVSSGQHVEYAKPGARINWGATLAKNTSYVVSTTAGAVAPSTDLGSGDYMTLMAYGGGTAIAQVICDVKGAAVD